MSDPGTTYRTRDEVQAMRAEKDTIAGLKKNILDWGVTDESSLKVGLDSPLDLHLYDLNIFSSSSFCSTPFSPYNRPISFSNYLHSFTPFLVFFSPS